MTFNILGWYILYATIVVHSGSFAMACALAIPEGIVSSDPKTLEDFIEKR
jgi:hypothetical protein